MRIVGDSVIEVVGGVSVVTPVSVRLAGGLIPCMGGWCAARETCAHFHQPAWRQPAERLCGATDEPVPVKPRGRQ